MAALESNNHYLLNVNPSNRACQEYRFVLRVIENQDEGYLTPKIAFMAFQIMYHVFPLVLSFTMIAFSTTNWTPEI